MQEESSAEERRGLLGNILRGALTLAALPLAYVGFTFVRPKKQRAALPPLELGALDQWPRGKYRRFKYGERPVGVLRAENGVLRAFDLRCTHANCVVKWDNNDSFKCPCHGGAFDALGNVTATPPERPLTRLEILESDGKIVLHDVEIDPAASLR